MPRSEDVTLRDVRRRRHLTVFELARRSGVSHGAVARIESGETPTPRPDTLAALLDALGIARGVPLPAALPPRPVWQPMTVVYALGLRDAHEARSDAPGTAA